MCTEQWMWKWCVANMVTHTRNSCSAFNPSKVHTHSSEHTHTHTHTHCEHTPRAVGSHLCCSSRGAVVDSVPYSRAPQSWYWGWRERCTSPATYNSFQPENRTRNLCITNLTVWPLGHDFPISSSISNKLHWSLHLAALCMWPVWLRLVEKVDMYLLSQRLTSHPTNPNPSCQICNTACKNNGQQLAGLKTADRKNKHDVTNKSMQDQIT